MHPFIYLFKLFLVIILTTLQACFFHRGAQQNLSKQIPSYTVSLRSNNQKGYFEDQMIPIDMLFASQDENIKNNGMGFRIKKISIEGISGHLETEDGDLLGDGYDFVYKDDGYPLFFIPAVDEDSGHCTITLDTLLIDKYGNEAPESTHKLATYGLYICHKKAIKKSIQEEEIKCSETLKPLSEDHSIVINNSKLRTTTVSLEDNGYPFQDPGFFAQISCNKNISLTVGGKHLTGDEEWILDTWYFKGLVAGSLYDVSTNHKITTPLKLQVGTIYISCRAAIENLSGSPIVVLAIIHPDGRKKEIQIDVSSIILPILEAKLNKYTTLLSDLIYTTTDPDIRDKTIKASKEIIVKMGYLLGKEDEEEKTKIESIIKDYDTFLKENQARFENAVRASEILSVANAAIRDSVVFEENKYIPAWREEDQKEITEFLNEVEDSPELFSHLSKTIEKIREQLETIDLHFYKDDE
ncbi:hypothetical protein [Cardinium endosymbiont of Sogatella furcifera]|uniref:hypothetical protein n=1 Tax=Cardinium endosymbiont of Sogatella furcifera TaxID=650378 RepID=UPI000E0D64AC|nr:hypothetical protein [Cardinium endosymbiont of Sogatella furcifera]